MSRGRRRRSGGTLGDVFGLLGAGVQLVAEVGKHSPVEKVRNLSQTVENFLDANDPGRVSKRLRTDETHRLQAGDHIYSQRVGYTHHGIYVGSGRVIHYLLDHGICETTLDGFACGSNIHRKSSIKRYSDREIVRRAYARIGESDYNLFHNNCEHFANWCRNGS
ncbi:lecithin retinol acyltransferase family protein [Tumebacillus sp. ITR2]|uniref:Lecithin retinol acyltransferase family protein n=1 Tax=Tumebacillus amylolyticus TaxID=2801339 RepID=A0ABS1J6D2_9BACL|nr:lecithin retinol acyltransferase family protein [Tumebacillus amylolyticus]MBL0385228.1 lecithin retinol acyltransferase family protein [Tumebacillus amylolyticus]